MATAAILNYLHWTLKVRHIRSNTIITSSNNDCISGDATHTNSLKVQLVINHVFGNRGSSPIMFIDAAARRALELTSSSMLEVCCI